MANIHKEFIQEAHRVIEQIHGKDQPLEQEENKIRARLNEIKEERSKFSEANVHFQSYPPAGRENPCPKCFILDGIAREMKPIGSESEIDIFHCSRCDTDVEVNVE